MLIFILSFILSANPIETKVYNLPNGKILELLVPMKDKITRIEGPTWETPHGDCLMCLGNHLLGGHGITYEYLMKIGYDGWFTLHDNLHNDKNYKGHIGNDAYEIGYGNIPAPGGYGTIRQGRRR